MVSRGLFLIGLLVSSTCFASDYELPKGCAAMEGQHMVRFHGQAFPFTLMTYDLEVTFPKNSAGISFFTNFGVPNVREILDTEALVNSYTQYIVIPDLTVHECYAEPQTCLRSAQADLKYFMIAERGLIWPGDQASRDVLSCGMERIRLFSKKVRGEVLQQRIVQ